MELVKIQQKLKAPKTQYNSFGKYNYRDCEDILKAVKPILAENNCYLTISDDIVLINNRFYVKATARLYNTERLIAETSALAREEESKKGMDASQLTGSTSSYARKYALNGLFAIDDTKDSDNNNQSIQTVEEQNTPLTFFKKLIEKNPLKDKLIEEWEMTGGDKELQKALFRRVKNTGK